MEKPQKMPKVAKVKNKAPAEIQITAEQLLREAKERDLEILPPPPKQKISDREELADYQHRKRRGFEDNIRKNRSVISNWIKYAQWEESQKEIQRARSIYERALDVDHRNVTLWLKYTELEMRNKQVNHARNLWDRAVTILPRVNQFWYKYTYMEEMLGNVAEKNNADMIWESKKGGERPEGSMSNSRSPSNPQGDKKFIILKGEAKDEKKNIERLLENKKTTKNGARQVFERWMEWEPDEQAWNTYVNFELRYKEIDRARMIFQRFVYVHPEVKNWIRFAKFEDKHGFINSARSVFEKAIQFYGDESIDEKLYIAFAKFEEVQKEHDRARVIYKYALEHIPKERAQELYKAYTIHEKKFGDRTGIEDVIVSKRKFQYEEEVKANPNNYDAWFDYLRLIENEGKIEVIRDSYERAIANVPPSKEKDFWRRYIYLWINYALFEELEAEDMDRARQVYRACLELIPHKLFTFSKIWLLYAQFEIRNKNLTVARKALGTAIGKCPRDKLFRGYIDLEIQLREFDRCRRLYEKFLEFGPENCITWMRFAELEMLLGDVERSRAIYELAVSQPRLDMPELLWKAYIDFEIASGEMDKVRNLYERLLERTLHVKVWMSYAQFELEYSNEENSVQLARRIYERANQSLRSANQKEERVLLLEAWRDFEKKHGDEISISKLMEKMPKRIKKRQRVLAQDGSEEGWEEFFDYIFPEDETAKPNLKLLANAKAWKQKMQDIQEAKAEEESKNKNENEDADSPSSSSSSSVEGKS